MLRFGPCVALLLLLGAAPLLAQDTKALADALVRDLVARQDQQTWLWGDDLSTTARALDLLTRSPRRYNEVQGPFFRRAAALVAEAPAAQTPLDGAALEREAWRALALAGTVTRPLQRARDTALARLRARAADARGYAALTARRSWPDDGQPWPPSSPEDEPAVAVLLAADPTTVAAPPLSAPHAWARWARARRLRGVPPETWPEPPQLGAGEPLELAALLDALELVLAVHGLARPGDGPPPGDPEPVSPILTAPRERFAALETGLEWLDENHGHGTFGLGLGPDPSPEPGITALCLAAAMSASEELAREHPAWVDEGLDYLAGLQKSDGSISAYGVVVYTTSVALEAFVAAGREQDAEVIAAARGFLVEVQSDEGEGYERDEDPHYGGIGYGGDERPDLSNTNMALEAATRAKLPADSPLFAKALIFLERNQNLAEERTRAWPRPDGGLTVSGNDGGATYMPGSSPAGEDELNPGVWVARSYGSMTFALLKSYLFCGVPPDDARVQAALRWITRNYTFDTNPGFADPSQAGDGLFYYYLAAGRALSQAAPAGLFDERGQRLDWKADLSAALLRQQRQNGSWINEASPRWYEGNPALCTAYALLALTTTR